MTDTPKRRRSAGVHVSGLVRPSAPRKIAAIGMATAMMLLAGCSAPPEEGEVVTGADGQNYVIPDGAERPTYASKEDCIADVTEQIAKLERDGESIEGTPETLCESSESYGTHYASGSTLLWLGPMLFASSRWNSPRVQTWAPVTGGGFAAPGSSAHTGVASQAPAGAKVGSRAPLSNGFGSSGKSGFGSSVKSSKAKSGGSSTGG